MKVDTLRTMKLKLVTFTVLVAAGLFDLLNPSRAATVTIPKGLPEQLYNELIPTNNPMTPEKIALGEKLFFDKRISSDRTVSCATCHDPATALADRNAVGIGIELKKGARN